MSAMKIRAAAIAELEDKFGRVTAEKLVDAAKDRRHPLHDDFEWNDGEAARLHRLNQARQIISSVRVVFRTTTEKRVSSVAYVRDPQAAATGEAGYVSIAKLRTEEDAALETLTTEVGRIQAALERAREIAAVLELTDELNAALDAVMVLSGRLRRGPNVEQPRLDA